MPLSDSRRKQLDDIVLKMGKQNAPKEAVQAIVSDFKSKYENEDTAPENPTSTQNPGFFQQGGTGEKIAQKVAQAPGQIKSLLKEETKGFGKGALNTVKNAANMGNRVLSAITSPITGVKAEEDPATSIQNLVEGKLNLPQNTLTTPTNTGQKMGYVGEQIGEFLAPESKVAEAGKGVEEAIKGGSVVKNLLRGIAKTVPEAVTGAGQQAIQEGNSNPEDFIRNALFFGGLSKGSELLGKGAKFALDHLPGKLYDSAVKPTLDEARKAVKFNGETLSDELISRNIKGGNKTILKNTTNKIEEAENKLQDILKNSKQTITKDEISKYLEPLVDKMTNTPGLQGDFDALHKVLNELPNEMHISKANELKRNIYSALSDTAYRLDPSLSSKREAMKTVANGIKTEIEKKTASEVGEGVVRNINKDLSVYGRARDRVIDNLAKEQKKSLVGLKDMTTFGAGVLAGGPLGGLASEALNKLSESTAFKTNAAVALKKLGQNLDKIPVDQAGKISKAALLKLFGSLTQMK